MIKSGNSGCGNSGIVGGGLIGFIGAKLGDGSKEAVGLLVGGFSDNDLGLGSIGEMTLDKTGGSSSFPFPQQ